MTKPTYVTAFLAEIKKVTASKSASLDKVYKLELVTSDPNVMNISVLAADELVKVTVEPEGEL